MTNLVRSRRAQVGLFPEIITQSFSTLEFYINTYGISDANLYEKMNTTIITTNLVESSRVQSGMVSEIIT
jgi:hypothetical protein